jgi:hypothetical protein
MTTNVLDLNTAAGVATYVKTFTNDQLAIDAVDSAWVCMDGVR